MPSQLIAYQLAGPGDRILADPLRPSFELGRRTAFASRKLRYIPAMSGEPLWEQRVLGRDDLRTGYSDAFLDRRLSTFIVGWPTSASIASTIAEPQPGTRTISGHVPVSAQEHGGPTYKPACSILCATSLGNAASDLGSNR